MLASACAVTAATIAATVDVRTGKIPNALVATTATSGLALAAIGWTGGSMTAAAVGLLVGGALMLPGHLIGGTGAGDVKLLAALGTLVGPQQIVLTWVYSAIAGGVLACAVAVSRGRLQETMAGAARLMTRRPDAGREIRARGRNRYALGPAILIGMLVASFVG